MATLCLRAINASEFAFVNMCVAMNDSFTIVFTNRFSHWQHGHCVNINDEHSVPKPYLCKKCITKKKSSKSRNIIIRFSIKKRKTTKRNRRLNNKQVTYTPCSKNYYDVKNTSKRKISTISSDTTQNKRVRLSTVNDEMLDCMKIMREDYNLFLNETINYRPIFGDYRLSSRHIAIIRKVDEVCDDCIRFSFYWLFLYRN